MSTKAKQSRNNYTRIPDYYNDCFIVCLSMLYIFKKNSLSFKWIHLIINTLKHNWTFFLSCVHKISVGGTPTNHLGDIWCMLLSESKQCVVCKTTDCYHECLKKKLATWFYSKPLNNIHEFCLMYLEAWKRNILHQNSRFLLCFLSFF